ncbi:hypothetical protein BJ912DRAFT_923403 [Pholiota molesta]|nr:hypothetical protein BJ912DRAFT_923403 [Pholiota molesta]
MAIKINPEPIAQNPDHRFPITISRLPAELEREIFDIAVSEAPQCIPSFVLLARRFRIWYEPELYRIIRSGEGKVIPPLYHDHRRRTPVLQLLKLKVPPKEESALRLDRLQHFGPWVRHILLQNRPAHEIQQVLDACPHVADLALWIVHGACTPLIGTLERLPALRRLSFDPTAFFVSVPTSGGGGGGGGAADDFSIAFAQPMFRNLTHLEIINVSSSWAKWRQLALLPRLTHLALANVADQHFIDRILQECALLEVVVMFYLDLYSLGENVSFVQKDRRVVLLRSVVDHLEHWEVGARGGVDFWVTAERRVAEGEKMRMSLALEDSYDDDY